jgi:DNA modification methylase
MKIDTFYHGSAQDIPRFVANESIHTCITSPPYYQLRDYKVDAEAWPEIRYSPMAGLPPITIPAMQCCLGLEPTVEAFIGHLLCIFGGKHIAGGVYQALRQDGTLWVNMGDTYRSPGGKRDRAKQGTGLAGTTTNEDAQGQMRAQPTNAKPKDLLGIPWRLAFALQAAGWTLRQDIIWHKTNAMPESVRDRCVKAHEHLFLFSKEPRYYFDHQLIQEPGGG